MTTTSERPREFDAALVRYLPAIQARVARRVGNGAARDVMQDVMASACKNWRSYRGDSYEHGSGFYMWLCWRIPAVLCAYNKRRRIEAIPCGLTPDYCRHHAVDGGQEYASDLRWANERLQTREGRVLQRWATGETLEEIAGDMGLSRQRAQQLKNLAQRRLLEMV